MEGGTCGLGLVVTPTEPPGCGWPVPPKARVPGPESLVRPHPPTGPHRPRVCRSPRDTPALRRDGTPHEGLPPDIYLREEKTGTEVVSVGPDTRGCDPPAPPARPRPTLSEAPGSHDRPPSGPPDALLTDVTQVDTAAESRHGDRSRPHTGSLGGGGSGTIPGSPSEGPGAEADTSRHGAQAQAGGMRPSPFAHLVATGPGQGRSVAEGSGPGWRAAPGPLQPSGLLS